MTEVQQGIIRVFLAYRDKFGRDRMIEALKDYRPSQAARMLEICDKAWANGNKGQIGNMKGMS